MKRLCTKEYEEEIQEEYAKTKMCELLRTLSTQLQEVADTISEMEKTLREE